MKYFFALYLLITMFEAGAQNCVLTCPSNVLMQAEQGKGGAVVQYPAVSGNDHCGPITYTPASGSFFRIGSTSVIGTTASG